MTEASYFSCGVENVPYRQRQAMQAAEKKRIAAVAASGIPDEAALFLDIGTTTEAVAMALLEHKRLRVVTNNLHVAIILCANPKFEVIVAGGTARNRDLGTMGPETVEFVRGFSLDFAVLGISGIDDKGRLLDYDQRETRVAKAMVEQANKVFLVADHSKFDRRPPIQMGHLSEIDVLVTDRNPPDHVLEIVSAAGGEIQIA